MRGEADYELRLSAGAAQSAECTRAHAGMPAGSLVPDGRPGRRPWRCTWMKLVPCSDEKSQCQTLERTQSMLPASLLFERQPYGRWSGTLLSTGSGISITFSPRGKLECLSVVPLGRSLDPSIFAESGISIVQSDYVRCAIMGDLKEALQGSQANRGASKCLRGSERRGIARRTRGGGRSSYVRSVAYSAEGPERWRLCIN